MHNVKIAIKTVGLNIIISKGDFGFIVERSLTWSKREVLAITDSFESALTIAQAA